MKKEIVTVPPDMKLAELADMQGEIDVVTAKRHKNIDFINSLTKEHSTLNKSIEDFKYEHRQPTGLFFGDMSQCQNNKFNETKLNAVEKRQYENLQVRRDECGYELQSAQEELNSLQEQETALLAVVATLNGNYATECLLYLQNKQNEAEQQIVKIKEAIAFQEELIAREKAIKAPDLAAVIQERNEMLADIALGKSQAAELPEIDEKLRLATAKAEESAGLMDDIITIALQTISGLKRKLTITENDLQSINCAKTEAERRFLLAEAEKVGAEYIEAAKLVTAAFRRLLALNEILTKKGHQNIEGETSLSLTMLPTFNLINHRPHSLKGELVDIAEASSSQFLKMDMNAEQYRFYSKGINI